MNFSGNEDMYPLKKSTIYYCDRAPTQVRVEVMLRSSKEDIYGVLVDTPSWTEWYFGMKSCENIVCSTEHVGNENGGSDTTTDTSEASSDTISVRKAAVVGRKVEIGNLIAEEEFISLQQPGRGGVGDADAAWVWAFCVCKTNLPLFKTMVERVVLNEETGDKAAGTGDKKTKVVYKAGIEFTWLGKLFKPIIIRSMHDSWYKSLSGLDAYILNHKL